MPFSMTSYLLGVGTVVGALAFGIGSGVLVTRTAMNETSAAAHARAERLGRAVELAPAPASLTPAAASQVAADTKQDPAPPGEPATETGPGPVASVQPETPKADTRDEPEVKQAAPAKQSAPASRAEQKVAAPKNTAERKGERQKRYAERKTKTIAAARTRQWVSDEQGDRPERPMGFYGREGSGRVALLRELPRPRVIFRRDEPRFGWFRRFGPPPFGRPDEMLPIDEDDD